MKDKDYTQYAREIYDFPLATKAVGGTLIQSQDTFFLS